MANGSSSNLERETIRGRIYPELIDKKFPFYKRLNRLRNIEEEIRALFDKPDEIKQKHRGPHKIYDGEITGIEARIEVRKNQSPRLYARTEGDLEKAYKKVRDALIRR